MTLALGFDSEVVLTGSEAAETSSRAWDGNVGTYAEMGPVWECGNIKPTTVGVRNNVNVCEKVWKLSSCGCVEL